MPTITERMIDKARRLALVLGQSGYQADFSVDSLREIERVLDEHMVGRQPRPGGLLSTNPKSRIVELGAYIGEVVRRDRGGQWTFDPDEPRNGASVVLQLPDGTTLRPIERILKRIDRGPETKIAAWYQRLQQGPATAGTSIGVAASVVRPMRPSIRVPRGSGTVILDDAETAESNTAAARRKRFWWCMTAAVAVWLGMSFVGGIYRPLGIAAIVIGVVASLGFVAFSWWLALAHAWRNKPILVPFFFLPLYFVKYSLRSLPETKLALIMLAAGMATSTAIFMVVIPTRIVGEVIGSIIFDEGEPTQTVESHTNQAGVQPPDPMQSIPPPFPGAPFPGDPFLTPPGVLPGPGPMFDPGMLPDAERQARSGTSGNASYPDSIEQAMQDLETSDPLRRRRAVSYLSRFDHNRERTDVADKFLALLEHDLDPPLVDGLIAWGSRTHLTGMTDVARRLETFQLCELLLAIWRIDRDTGVNLAIELMKDPKTRRYAQTALQRIGDDAEPEILTLLTHTDPDTRQGAANLLRFLGNSASLEPLAAQIAVERDSSVRRSMESALRSIQRRAMRE